MKRVRRGMTIDELRDIWLERAEALTKKIMDKYYSRRDEAGGGYGQEGLGVYGIYRERASREKARLAVKVLEQAGLEASSHNIRKLTQKSSSTTRTNRASSRIDAPSSQPQDSVDEQPRIIRFPGSI